MNNVSFDFENKNVLVLGGSRGIGKEVCNQFIKAGALVTSISRSECKLDKVKNVICDISSSQQLTKTLESIKEVDILINVAGTNLCAPIEKINIPEWDRVLDTNLKSFFIVIKHISKIMKKNKGGKIVNVSSIAGKSKSIVSGVHYTASKYGIIGLTKQLAQELGVYNINVNCVCPSQTMTQMLINSMSKNNIAELKKKIPVGRISSVKEQAYPILFLCTQEASYIHGAAIDVNGGQF
jgi:3-oxoacyl-[acyl-carrier protein] reductase